MTANPVAPGTGHDARVEAEIRGAALGQLLRGGPLAEALHVLLVLAGIVAGATGTLVGDRRSFHYLLLTALVPLPIGILLQGHSRPHLIATLLTALFAWSMDRVHRRAHRTFTERVRATVLLESS